MNKNTLDITKGERTKIAGITAAACTLSTAFDTYKNQVNEAALAMVKAGFLPRFATHKGSKESAFALACNMALRTGIVESIADPRLRAAVQMPKADLGELCKADKDARDTYISGTLNARVLALGLEIAKALPDLTESKVMIAKAEKDAERRAAAQAERRAKDKAAKIANAKATRAPQQPTAKDAPAPAPAPAVKGMTYTVRVNNLVVEAVNALKATGKSGTEKDLVFLNALKAALEEYNKK
jgi:hypothetical protein